MNSASKSSVTKTWSIPPVDLAFGRIHLHFAKIIPADTKRGLSPYYHFRILTAEEGINAGHLNFRLGDNEHLRLYAGHIGYEVAQPFRGRGYAEQACRAVARFVRTIYPAVILTVDPENVPSIRTIEKLGARFLGVVSVPPHDPQYATGSRLKRRYEWSLGA